MVFLTADIGTTNCKVALLNKEGTIQKMFSATVTSHENKPGWHEQDAEEIFNTFCGLLRQTINYSKNEQIKFISFSAAMHSLLAVDKAGKPLMNAITWADTRSTNYAERIKKQKNAADIYKHTGTPIHSMSPLVKLVWLKKERKDIFNETYKFISIKEYIFYRLFNTYIIDYSMACATGLFDIEKLKYYKPSLKLAGIQEEQLSQVVEPTHTEHLSAEMQQQLNLPANVPFVAGGSDGCLANLGNALLNNKKAAVTVGTSAAARVSGSKPLYDKKQRLFSYALDKKFYVSGGALNNGGSALQWFVEEILNETPGSNEISIDQCVQLAMQSPPGANGLIFLPYLLGERAPMWDGRARAAFIGLLSVHTREHLARAVLEGIAFAVCQVLHALEEVSGNIQEICLNGGLGSSPAWAQLFSDVTGKKVVVKDKEEASLSGALFVGMKATGIIKDYSEITFTKHSGKEYIPNQKLHDYYQRLQSVYNNLYQVLRKSFHQLYTLPQIKTIPANEAV